MTPQVLRFEDWTAPVPAVERKVVEALPESP